MKQSLEEQLAAELDEVELPAEHVAAGDYLAVLADDVGGAFGAAGRWLFQGATGMLPMRWQLKLESRFSWYDAETATAASAVVFSPLLYGIVGYRADTLLLEPYRGAGFAVGALCGLFVGFGRLLCADAGGSVDAMYGADENYRTVGGDPVVWSLLLPYRAGEWAVGKAREYVGGVRQRAQQRAGGKR